MIDDCITWKLRLSIVNIPPQERKNLRADAATKLVGSSFSTPPIESLAVAG
jgi:hypothetical protein